MLRIGKLLKILKPYTQDQKLSYFDKNLFMSFYSKKGAELVEEGDVQLVVPEKSSRNINNNSRQIHPT